eukprot:CAMPEP_0180059248 /NCGR_PEP_ID=MMETSP0985-20121206/5441_1 /TAXON_ID=483367 /ORGANISM="non described non described, Strain CCMP 2436" /LENGTH=142 /DNA_ID=CAMNT_0021989259 /DNA_START=52 /DNA_END=478 /DNA_ORIENTATION=+
MKKALGRANHRPNPVSRASGGGKRARNGRSAAARDVTGRLLSWARHRYRAAAARVQTARALAECASSKRAEHDAPAVATPCDTEYDSARAPNGARSPRGHREDRRPPRARVRPASRARDPAVRAASWPAKGGPRSGSWRRGS